MNVVLINIIVVSLSVIISIVVWLKLGKDAAGTGTIVPEYQPPVDLSPAEVGVLYDYKAADREITATLIDLTLRGFMSMQKIEKRQLLGNVSVYEFTLLQDDVLDLRDHEKALLNGLFGVVGAKYAAKLQSELKDPDSIREANSQYPAGLVSLIGQKAAIDDLKPYFFQYVAEAQTSLYQNLTNAGYFRSDPLSSGVGLMLMAVASLVVVLIFYPHITVGGIIAAFIFYGFSRVMKARGVLGQEAKEYIQGFLLYIKTAEIDRIKSLQGPGTALQDSVAVRLYKTYLPYAISLGLENEWTSKFSGAYKQQLGITEDLNDVYQSMSAVLK